MDDTIIVAALFATAGLHLTEAEVAGYAAVYPAIRGMVDSLYAVEEARYEPLALSFDPDPEQT